MITPVPNVLYNSLEEAKKRLYEYEIEINYVKTNKALVNHVFSYETKEPNVVVLYVALPPEGSFSLDDKIEYVHNIGFVTGRDSINCNLLVNAKAGATDLGIPVDLHDSMIYLYGDTFSGIDCNDGLWNSNFIARSNSKSYLNGLKFNEIITDENGIIKPIRQGKHHRNDEKNLDISLNKEVSCIPTGGIYLNGYVYIFIMSVRYWGEAGKWHVTNNQCYKAKKDDLEHFVKVDSLNFEEIEDNRFGQIFPFENPFDDKHIYFVSIPGGRVGNLSLLRVKKEQFENKNEYELCVGKNKWAKFNEGIKLKPYYLLIGNVSEPSIMYNKYLHKWMLTNIDGNQLNIHLCDELTSSFDEKIKVLTHKEVVSHYGGFVHPKMSLYDGKKIFMQVSQWSPIYNTSLIEIEFK